MTTKRAIAFLVTAIVLIHYSFSVKKEDGIFKVQPGDSIRDNLDA